MWHVCDIALCLYCWCVCNDSIITNTPTLKTSDVGVYVGEAEALGETKVCERERECTCTYMYLYLYLYVCACECVCVCDVLEVLTLDLEVSLYTSWHIHEYGMSRINQSWHV